MKLHPTFSINERLKILSNRLKYITVTDLQNSYQTYIDHKIKTENLNYNISLILANIILKLKLVDRSKSRFNKIVEEYNDNNKTDLNFEDFEKTLWIRLINDEIKIPEVISHYLLEVDSKIKQGNSIEFPREKEQIVKCLLIFYQKCYYNPMLIIDSNILDEVLEKFSNEIDKKFLINNKILEYNENDNSYVWIDNEYLRQLKNEIFSTIWLSSCGEEANETQFRKFLRYLEQLDVWPNCLELFLSPQNISRICELSFSILNNETDLDNSGSEFNKIWLDSNLYSHVTIETEIPVLKFFANTPLTLISEFEYHKWRFQDIFDYQETRNVFNLLILFVIQYDDKFNNPFKRTLSLLSNLGKPYLIWQTYINLSKKYPEVIPYLLNQYELAPIAYKLIDELEIKPDLLPYSEINDKKLQEKLKFIKSLWFNLFEITLEQISSFNMLVKGIK